MLIKLFQKLKRALELVFLPHCLIILITNRAFKMKLKYETQIFLEGESPTLTRSFDSVVRLYLRLRENNLLCCIFLDLANRFSWRRHFQRISKFFSSFFCESLNLAFPQILSKTSTRLVSIGGLKSSLTDARKFLYELSWSPPSTSASESALEYLLSESLESFLWQVLS